MASGWLCTTTCQFPQTLHMAGQSLISGLDREILPPCCPEHFVRCIEVDDEDADADPQVAGQVRDVGEQLHEVELEVAGVGAASGGGYVGRGRPAVALAVLELGAQREALDDPGHGVVAQLDGATVLVGNEALLLKHGYSKPVERAPDTPDPAQTLVHVARLGADQRVELLGLVSLSDPIKPDSAEAIRQLHAMNLRTLLLTGDNQATAEFIARQAGIDDVRAQVKPGGKADGDSLIAAANLAFVLGTMTSPQAAERVSYR